MWFSGLVAALLWPSSLANFGTDEPILRTHNRDQEQNATLENVLVVVREALDLAHSLHGPNPNDPSASHVNNLNSSQVGQIWQDYFGTFENQTTISLLIIENLFRKARLATDSTIWCCRSSFQALCKDPETLACVTQTWAAKVARAYGSAAKDYKQFPSLWRTRVLPSDDELDFWAGDAILADAQDRFIAPTLIHELIHVAGTPPECE